MKGENYFHLRNYLRISILNFNHNNLISSARLPWRQTRHLVPFNGPATINQNNIEFKRKLFYFKQFNLKKKFMKEGPKFQLPSVFHLIQSDTGYN